MRNLGKFFVVACGMVLALSATSTNSKAQIKSPESGEGCRSTGDCGTTKGGVKLNGSWTVWE